MSDPRAREHRRRDHRLLTVKEYADLVRQHPQSVYRRIREGRQSGMYRVGGSIRLRPLSDDDHDDED
jgi:hypothetical protein